MLDVKIDCEGADQLQDLLTKRIEVLHQTPKKAVTSMALNILRSIRAITKKAKTSGIKVNVMADASLNPSYKTVGLKKYRVIRCGKVEYVKRQDETINWDAYVPSVKNYVFRCELPFSKDRRIKNLIIVAPSKAVAVKQAKQRIKKRIIRYRGTAKVAWSLLMRKTFLSASGSGMSGTTKDAVDTAYKYTESKIHEAKDAYSVQITDGLEYAKLALKGGEGALGIAINNARRKMEGDLHRRLKQILNR